MTAEEPPTEPTGPAKHWLGIIDRAHDLIAPRVDARKTKVAVDFFEQIESDLAPVVAPIIDKLLSNPATPDELRPLLGLLATPEHAGDTILLGVALGSILSPALATVVQPAVQPLANEFWKALPEVPLSPAILAEMALKGIDLTGNTQIGSSGLATEALNSGIVESRFAAMTQAAGQSIGLQEGLLLFRRKQIPWDSSDASAPGMLQILQYSNINPRFYNTIQDLQYVPISAGEVVTANLKGHLDDATAITMLQEAGIDGAAPVAGGTNVQQLLRASAGRPPGIEQMLELRNRSTAGLTATPVTDADVAAAVRQSDINDTFLPFIMELGHYFPPPRSIVPMLRAKAINETQARQLLTAYGVGEPWASAFVKEGQTTSTSAVKGLTATQLVAQYEARLMPAATALTRIEALGYDASDAQAYLDLADEKRTAAMQNATMRKIGAEYIGYKITLAEATNAMGAAGIPTAAQNDAVHYWNVEQSVNIHKPTPPQIVGAFRRGDIDGAEAHSRLLASGVLLSDMHIVAADGFPPTKPNPQAVAIIVSGQALYIGGTSAPPATGVKAETLTQITQLYVARTITRAAALTKIEALGYSAADAADLITLAGPQIPLPTTSPATP